LFFASVFLQARFDTPVTLPNNHDDASLPVGGQEVIGRQIKGFSA
jgi:hypothetical protein